ncbi:type II toxin-antitoxin system RelE/ParE family toxin [Dyadobacter psychrotolerans]|uniref:Type II toxin-antitoxin system RelE/ParE family toxin n=1 Tax=Dyadobacter psychrotolerans TaxID=2541721 RepID=A0A4R5DGN8_9BACT|nr:type II toxin-antitoxin system RelE/ParE family toxin [Dyadobacter psychrotolerans]
MAYQLLFSPEALLDITDTASYYEEIKKGLGKRFRNELKRKFLLIKVTPMIYSIRYNHVRTALLDIFPYSIPFNVLQDKGVIRIHAVLSHYRNPDQFWNDY